MTNRTRIVFGSLAGAFAIHVALVACTGASLVGARSDGGAGAPGVDAFVDALAAGDLGQALDVATDAAIDALADVAGAEMSDAHAGGDAGACGCAPVFDYSFSLNSFDRGRGAESPPVDYSTASVSAQPTLLRGPAVQIVGVGTFILPDDTRVSISCQGPVRPTGEIISLQCSTQMSAASGDGGVTSFVSVVPATVEGAVVSRLTDTDLELRTTRITAATVINYDSTRPGPTLTFSGFACRAHVDGGRFLTPSRALRR